MESAFTIIAPAAGLGERFLAAGYKASKPMIQFTFNGVHRSMLHHAVSSVAGMKRPVVVGVLASQVTEASSAWPTFHKVPIQETRGQADTIYQILRYVEGPILVVNSDAALCVPDRIWGLTGYSLETLCINVKERLSPVHSKPIPDDLYHSSPYSHVGSVPVFSQMAEKTYLSAFACAGAWWFRDATELRLRLKISLSGGSSTKGEYYLSTALNGLEGYAHILNPEQYNSWNTPAELEADPAVSEIWKG